MMDKSPYLSPVPSSLEGQALERKIWLGKWALFFEDLWPRLWVFIAIAIAFVLLSLAGVWPFVGDNWHKALLALFGAAMLAAVFHASRVRWPSRQTAIRRLERDSGLAHRPASSYEDTLSGEAHNPATAELWRAHRDWLSRLLGRLHVGHPRPRVYRRDPFALRMLLMLVVLLLAVAAGDGAGDRLRAAFRFDSEAQAAAARLDAWVAPPAYTSKPPVMLADGARPEKSEIAKNGVSFEVPEKSVLFVRSSGASGATLALGVVEDGGAPRRIDAKSIGSTGDVLELKFEIKARSSQVRVLVSGVERESWDFSAIPDLPPKIALTAEPEYLARGAMKLTYKVEDDYGVANAEVDFTRTVQKDGPAATAWARGSGFTGPRFTLDRPPRLALRLPRANAKESEAQSYLELGSHPWAGIEVAMTLEAKDIAGKIGRSAAVTLTLPARRFVKPLARAVVEQRRKLVEDSRARDRVLTALAALTLEPDGFIEDPRAYLGLRSAYYRLRQDETRAGWKDVIDQLWHVALRIEDGDLSDAERALRDAQDKLSKALEDGAADEEIKQLLAELRQALDQYMKQMAKQAENTARTPEGQDPNNQSISQRDLERMMKNIEEMAKSGSREQAQQMLSQLRDIMERMQSGRMTEQQAEKSQEMIRMLNELGGLVGQQQKLMDDTFSEQRNLEGQPQDQPGRKGAQKGQSGQGKGAPRQGKQGQGQAQGQGQGQGDDPGQQGQPGGLGDRQAELREQLRQLQQGLGEAGMGNPDQLDGARQAMEDAERALKEGDFGSATEEQARALDEMRQGAQSMAQEMLQNSPRRFGQSGDTPRDPLGRPQRSQGPDLGTSVKVPDQIDMQRAREILEELRRRLGEPTRPAGEIDYIERLLRRF